MLNYHFLGGDWEKFYKEKWKQYVEEKENTKRYEDNLVKRQERYNYFFNWILIYLSFYDEHLRGEGIRELFLNFDNKKI